MYEDDTEVDSPIPPLTQLYRVKEPTVETDHVLWQPSQSLPPVLDALLTEAARKRAQPRATRTLIPLQNDAPPLLSEAVARPRACTRIRSRQVRPGLYPHTTREPSPPAGTADAECKAAWQSLLEDTLRQMNENAHAKKREMEQQKKKLKAARRRATVGCDGSTSSVRPKQKAPGGLRRDQSAPSLNGSLPGPRHLSRTRSGSAQDRCADSESNQDVEMTDLDSWGTGSSVQVHCVDDGHDVSRHAQMLLSPPPMFRRSGAPAIRPVPVQTDSLPSLEVEMRSPITMQSTLSSTKALITPPEESPPRRHKSTTVSKSPSRIQTRSVEQQGNARPRALGMRPTSYLPSSQFALSQTLPTKQKPFKPPLARPGAALKPAPLPVDTATSLQMSARSNVPAQPAGNTALIPPDVTPPTDSSTRAVQNGDTVGRPRSPPTPADANSSFGEIEFAYDLNALEDVMQEYD